MFVVGRWWARAPSPAPWSQPLAPSPQPLLRFNPQNRSLFLVSEEIQQAVWSLAHIADSLAQLTQQRFAAELFHLLVEENAFCLLYTSDAADE